MRTIKNPFAVELVKKVVDRIPTKRRGSYNQSFDATAFEEGEVHIVGYNITFRDVTWGINVEIENDNEYNLDKFRSQLYLDADGNVICDHGIEKGTFKILHEASKALIECNYPTREERYELEMNDSSDSSIHGYI